MNIRSLAPDSLLNEGKISDLTSDKTTPGGASFEQVLGNALDQVNNLQLQSAAVDEKLAAGQLEYLHQAVVLGEKAEMALQLTIQVRNKVLEAYQELMRTQL